MTEASSGVARILFVTTPKTGLWRARIRVTCCRCVCKGLNYVTHFVWFLAIRGQIGVCRGLLERLFMEWKEVIWSQIKPCCCHSYLVLCHYHGGWLGANRVLEKGKHYICNIPPTAGQSQYGCMWPVPRYCSAIWRPPPLCDVCLLLGFLFHLAHWQGYGTATPYTEWAVIVNLSGI